MDRLKNALADRYVIEEELGAGGMATVYLAQDLKHHRNVAIKVLRPEVAVALGPERFLREIEISANLNHPHILPLHDSGTADEYFYYVMPVVEGEPLSARIQRERQLSVEEAVKIACEVADALNYAHGRGVVHRDIKPENILLDAGHAMVTDFGIARAIQAAGGERLTTAGMAIGTPWYMSPEQAAGDEELDGRSDIYSLGCVLYEMLAGEPPFTGPSAISVIAKRMTEPAPRLSVVRETVPPAIDRAVSRALAKLPADRFATAADLIDALSASSTATGPTLDSLAVLPFATPPDDTDAEYLSDGITETVINLLSGVASLRVVPRATVFRYRGCDDPLAAARELRVSAVVTGRLTQRGDTLVVTADLVDVVNESQLWGDRYHRKFSDIFAVQEEMATEISRSLRLKLTGQEERRMAKRETEDAEAYQAYLKGRYHWNKRTGAGFSQATGYFRDAIDKDPGYALALAGLADTYNVQGYYNHRPPRDTYPKAVASAKQALEVDDGLAEAHASLGFAHLFYDRDWEASRKALLRAIELKPNYATAHQWYAWYLLIMERFAEALTEMQRALELDPLSLIMNDHVGYALYLARRPEEALQQLRRTLELDSTYPLSYWRLGTVHLERQAYEDAIEAYERAVDLTDGRLALGYLGQAYACAGRTQQATEVIARLESLADERYVSPLELALAHDGLGNVDATFEWLERGYDDRVSDLSRLKLLHWSTPVREDARFAGLVRRLGLAA